MFTRVVLLACFLICINLAAAEIELLKRMKCVAEKGGFSGDPIAEVVVSNTKCINILYITQKSDNLMKSIKVLWYNNFCFTFLGNR